MMPFSDMMPPDRNAAEMMLDLKNRIKAPKIQDTAQFPPRINNTKEAPTQKSSSAPSNVDHGPHPHTPLVSGEKNRAPTKQSNPIDRPNKIVSATNWL